MALSGAGLHQLCTFVAWTLVLRIVLAQGLEKSHLVRTANYNSEGCLVSIKLERGGLDILKGYFQCALVARYSVLFNSGAILRKRPGRGHLKSQHPSPQQGWKSTSPSLLLLNYCHHSPKAAAIAAPCVRLQDCISSLLTPFASLAFWWDFEGIP